MNEALILTQLTSMFGLPVVIAGGQFMLYVVETKVRPSHYLEQDIDDAIAEGNCPLSAEEAKKSRQVFWVALRLISDGSGSYLLVPSTSQRRAVYWMARMYASLQDTGSADASAYLNEPGGLELDEQELVAWLKTYTDTTEIHHATHGSVSALARELGAGAGRAAVSALTQNLAENLEHMKAMISVVDGLRGLRSSVMDALDKSMNTPLGLDEEST